jgi:hypothetical protein
MPVVARIDGIKIRFFNDEHPPPHFHAEYAEHVAVTRREALLQAWDKCRSDLNPGKIE